MARFHAIDRFAAKVALTDSGCVEWIAGVDSSGYGLFHIYPDGVDRTLKAHRWSYEHHIGPIPEGLYVLHSCDNPPCVNPEHLRAGTHTDNMRDRLARGARKTHCQSGHPFDEEHTYMTPDGRRKCRTCTNARRRARRRGLAA